MDGRADDVPDASTGSTRLSRLARLATLYFVQGIPFGIQVGILPILLRERGESRTTIAISGILGLPWLLKVVVAPIVESVYSPRLGRRRSWILPMQLVAFVALVALAFASKGTSLVPMFVAVFVMNLAMATMDIAVDGLAVDWLSDDELGPGNAAQVGGFKVGMLVAGGLSLQLLRWFEWPAVFLSMAGFVAIAFATTLAFHEPERFALKVAEVVRYGDLGKMTLRLVLDPATRWLVVLVLGYKAGESMADAQFRPFLVDAGFDAQTIGLYIGLYGGIASAFGSFVAGAIGARSRSLVDTLFVVAALRAIPLLMQAFVAFARPPSEVIIAVSLLEHFGGGLLTTFVFALMMSAADPARGGTSFTVYSTIDVVGRGVTSFFSGLVADHAGDVTVFSLAAVLSLAFVFLHRPLRRYEDEGAFERSRYVSA